MVINVEIIQRFSTDEEKKKIEEFERARARFFDEVELHSNRRAEAVSSGNKAAATEEEKIITTLSARFNEEVQEPQLDLGIELFRRYAESFGDTPAAALENIIATIKKELDEITPEVYAEEYPDFLENPDYIYIDEINNNKATTREKTRFYIITRFEPLYLAHVFIGGKEQIDKLISDKVTELTGIPSNDESGTSRTETETAERKNRTISNAIAAADAQLINTYPESLISPTLLHYRYAMSFHSEKGSHAHLGVIPPEKKFEFENGILYFEDEGQKLTKAELKDIRTNESIKDFDLPLLQSFYAIILNNYQKSGFKEIKDKITLYVPDLVKSLGVKNKRNKYSSNDGNAIIDKLKELHTVVGIMNGVDYPQRNSQYPVLIFQGYDSDKNTVSFSSPYINELIRRITNAAARRNKAGEITRRADGTPLFVANQTYSIKMSLASKRDKAAAENVRIICTTIETAGDNKPHIHLKSLIERNPLFKYRLEKSSNKSRDLQRVMKDTFEYLRTETHLTDMYEDIKLPDPNNPANIPTLSKIDMVYTFPHKGKKRKSSNE